MNPLTVQHVLEGMPLKERELEDVCERLLESGCNLDKIILGLEELLAWINIIKGEKINVSSKLPFRNNHGG